MAAKIVAREIKYSLGCTLLEDVNERFGGGIRKAVEAHAYDFHRLIRFQGISKDNAGIVVHVISTKAICFYVCHCNGGDA